MAGVGHLEDWGQRRRRRVPLPGGTGCAGRHRHHRGQVQDVFGFAWLGGAGLAASCGRRAQHVAPTRRQVGAAPAALAPDCCASLLPPPACCPGSGSPSDAALAKLRGIILDQAAKGKRILVRAGGCRLQQGRSAGSAAWACEGAHRELPACLKPWWWDPPLRFAHVPTCKQHMPALPPLRCWHRASVAAWAKSPWRTMGRTPIYSTWLHQTFTPMHVRCAAGPSREGRWVLAPRPAPAGS